MKIYTTDEVADLLRIDPATVRRWVAAGRLGGFKAGRNWRVTEEDLQRFIQANRATEETPR